MWLRGGLGNQLFQYAFGLVLSNSTGRRLELRADLLPRTRDEIAGISRWPQQLSRLQHSGVLLAHRHQPPSSTNLQAKWFSVLEVITGWAPLFFAKLGQFSKVQEGDGPIHRPNNPTWMNIDCRGYFVDKNFPGEVRDQLRREILPLKHSSRNLTERCEKLGGTIAIHVRLGDFVALNPNLYAEYSDFFSKALELLGAIDAKRRFTLFSDDAQSAKELLLRLGYPPLEIFDDAGMDPAEVLVCLSSCSGLVACPSTFAWWGAFLQDLHAGPVIFKAPWSSDEKSSGSERVYLKNWIKIGVPLEPPTFL